MNVRAATASAADITVEDRELFDRVNILVEAIPDLFAPLPMDERMSRHVIASVVCEVLPLTLTVGLFGGAYEHSWCLTRFHSVIDPLPIGITPNSPILVDCMAAQMMYRKRLPQAKLPMTWAAQAIKQIIESLKDKPA